VIVPDRGPGPYGGERLEGETVVVTGGAAGIGRAIAIRFAAEGAQVAVADIDGQGAARVTGEIQDSGNKALAIETDVTDEASVTRMAHTVAAELGMTSILVNNAAGDPVDDMLAMSTAGWQRDLELTLTGPFLATRAVLPGMLDEGRGAILNIVSLNAFIALGNEAYSAAKAGLVSLTRSTAVRYGAKGIRANAIAPGTILTYAPNQKTRLARDPKVFERLRKWYPLGRIGTPDDVASAALFLCSREAGWITGIVLRVDGGVLAGTMPFIRELHGWAADD
jgi:meso-butanediol dehydrogenase / (S,S)-butanediol dehydrogenase / diacetyl reductase